jgi:hypothetical protein
MGSSLRIFVPVVLFDSEGLRLPAQKSHPTANACGGLTDCCDCVPLDIEIVTGDDKWFPSYQPSVVQVVRGRGLDRAVRGSGVMPRSGRVPEDWSCARR